MKAVIENIFFNLESLLPIAASKDMYYLSHGFDFAPRTCKSSECVVLTFLAAVINKNMTMKITVMFVP